jgi:hypothetical protein
MVHVLDLHMAWLLTAAMAAISGQKPSQAHIHRAINSVCVLIAATLPVLPGQGLPIERLGPTCLAFPYTLG